MAGPSPVSCGLQELMELDAMQVWRQPALPDDLLAATEHAQGSASTLGGELGIDGAGVALVV